MRPSWPSWRGRTTSQSQKPTASVADCVGSRGDFPGVRHGDRRIHLGPVEAPHRATDCGSERDSDTLAIGCGTPSAASGHDGHCTAGHGHCVAYSDASTYHGAVQRDAVTRTDSTR